MSEKKKLTSEEVEQLRKLQELYSQLTIKLGQVQIEKIIVKGQLQKLTNLETDLEQEYKSTQESETQFLKVLESKYGAITVDLETGDIS